MQQAASTMRNECEPIYYKQTAPLGRNSDSDSREKDQQTKRWHKQMEKCVQASTHTGRGVIQIVILQGVSFLISSIACYFERANDISRPALVSPFKGLLCSGNWNVPRWRLSMHTSCLKQICSLYSAKSVFYLRVSTPSVPETGRPKPKTDTRFVVTAWSWLFCPGFPVSGMEGVKHYAKPTKLLN